VCVRLVTGERIDAVMKDWLVLFIIRCSEKWYSRNSDALISEAQDTPIDAGRPARALSPGDVDAGSGRHFWNGEPVEKKGNSHMCLTRHNSLSGFKSIILISESNWKNKCMAIIRQYKKTKCINSCWARIKHNILNRRVSCRPTRVCSQTRTRRCVLIRRSE